jgi:hypothetical protein
LNLVQKELFKHNAALVMPESRVTDDTARLAFITEQEAQEGVKALREQGWEPEGTYQRASSEPFLWFVMAKKT